MKKLNLNYSFPYESIDRENFLHSYLANGFVVIEDLFIKAEVESILLDINSILQAALGNDKNETSDSSLVIAQESIFTRMKLLLQTNPSFYHKSISAIESLSSIGNLASSDRVIRCVKKLGIEIPAMSARPVCNFLVANDGEESTQKALAHQDWAFMRGSLDSATLWFPLFDISESGYPLEVIPGSHLNGLLPFHSKNLEITPKDLPEDDFIKLLPKRGDAILFSSFLVHRTGETAGAKDSRLAISTRYNNLKEDSYIERGYYEPFYFKEKAEDIPFDVSMHDRFNKIFTSALSNSDNLAL
ncbi:hypothetical protein WSM22_34590 [Cytophagales bacterium WSM2-2]|nr:hypothetical protein WSM22_34590 [Cytophagales bacterium WSM2-2]